MSRAAWLFLSTMLAGCSFTPTQHGVRIDSAAIVGLEDVRFSPAHIRQGVWSPHEFSRAARGGIFFLERPVVQRVPVLFIHGINGSPRDFKYLISHLDRRRFQPCVFFYASGASLSQIGRGLSEAMGELHSRYGIKSIVIVAHSIGGLIARDVLVNQFAHAGVSVPVMITLSSPWGGIPSAAMGVRWSPVVVDSWRDIAAGSAYLDSLFVADAGATRALPPPTRHYLMFSYRKSWSSLGVSSDEVTSVASQLTRAAQEQAYRVYGFDVSHGEIVRSPAVAELLGAVLSAGPEDLASPTEGLAREKTSSLFNVSSSATNPASRQRQGGVSPPWQLDPTWMSVP